MDDCREEGCSTWLERGSQRRQERGEQRLGTSDGLQHWWSGHETRQSQWDPRHDERKEVLIGNVRDWQSMSTPGKSRVSGIPTPGKSSGIPTPGRLRSSSSVVSANGAPPSDYDFASQALADAIKANNPAQHRDSVASSSSHPPTSGRRSVAGGRPSSVASSVSSTSYAATRQKPAPARPASRQSDVFMRSSSRAGRSLDVGDDVRIESLGFEGILRFLGEIDGKSGTWAGVELSGGFAGMGKNNGSVNG